mmetsp:Transcript_9986/g.25462  ORF Transcript_9986/g.25462 Transcript_9986/m.25462 type:complete len:119 (+) Transcript_9986:434-790(+)
MLDLGGNGIGDDGARALAEALTPKANLDGSWALHSMLAGLALHDNGITDSGACALAAALQPRTAAPDPNGRSCGLHAALVYLGLRDNEIGESGKAALRELEQAFHAHRPTEDMHVYMH